MAQQNINGHEQQEPSLFSVEAKGSLLDCLSMLFESWHCPFGATDVDVDLCSLEEIIGYDKSSCQK